MTSLATVLLDPPSTLLFGCAINVVAMKLIAANPQATIRKTVIISAVWSAWYGVCVGWFFFMRPDWMFTYLIDTAQVPLVPAFLVFWAALVGYGVVGALATGLLVQQKKTGLAIAATVVSAVFFGLLLFMSNPAYVKVGTFAQYWAGTAPAVDADAAMKTAMTVSGIGIGLGVVASLGVLFKKAKAA